MDRCIIVSCHAVVVALHACLCCLLPRQRRDNKRQLEQGGRAGPMHGWLHWTGLPSMQSPTLVSTLSPQFVDLTEENTRWMMDENWMINFFLCGKEFSINLWTQRDVTGHNILNTTRKTVPFKVHLLRTQTPQLRYNMSDSVTDSRNINNFTAMNQWNSWALE